MVNKIARKGVSIAGLAAIIVTATFGARASNSVIPSYGQLLGREFRFSATGLGLLAVSFMLSSFIASALINARLRTELRRKYFIASAAAYAIAYSLFYFANPYLIWPAMVIAGLAMGPIMPNIMTSAGSVEDPRVRERLLALYTLTLSVSLLVAQSVASLVLRYVSVRQGFLYLEPMAALVAISAPFLPFPKEASLARTVGPKGAQARASYVLKNEGFIASVLNNLTYQVPFSYLTAFAAVYVVQQFGAKGWLGVLAYAPFYATSLLSRLFMMLRPPGNIVKHMVLAASMSVAGLLMAWASGTLPVFYLAMAILGIPHGMTYTLSVISISRTFDRDRLNAANSYFFSIMMIIGSLLPALLGSLADRIGYRQTFLAITPIVIAILVLTLIFASRARSLRSQQLHP
ncbi:MAG: MFS transporter [Acidilobus sp.]